jgi:hypothetical protein
MDLTTCVRTPLQQIIVHDIALTAAAVWAQGAHSVPGEHRRAFSCATAPQQNTLWDERRTLRYLDDDH